MSNSSLADPPLPSVAVSFTVTVPTSPAIGVPKNILLPPRKVNHDGSAAPSAFVAV